MKIDILCLYPEFFNGPLDQSIIKQARKKGILDIDVVNIRDFAEDKHQRVDDRTYGGGPGMVLMAPPLARAIKSVKNPETHVVYLSPQGKKLTAAKCRELAERPHLLFLCGHYEGVDQRVLDLFVDEEISIGDYVLTDGCAAALVVMQGVIRFVPGVIGNADAANEDSFEVGKNGILDHPHYTRPEYFEGLRVPEVLLSGNHEKIAQWRYQVALENTKRMRPDLIEKEDIYE